MDENNKEEKVIVVIENTEPIEYEYGVLNKSHERYYRKFITR